MLNDWTGACSPKSTLFIEFSSIGVMLLQGTALVWSLNCVDRTLVLTHFALFIGPCWVHFLVSATFNFPNTRRFLIQSYDMFLVVIIYLRVRRVHILCFELPKPASNFERSKSSIILQILLTLGQLSPRYCFENLSSIVCPFFYISNLQGLIFNMYRWRVLMPTIIISITESFSINMQSYSWWGSKSCRIRL